MDAERNANPEPPGRLAAVKPRADAGRGFVESGLAETWAEAYPYMRFIKAPFTSSIYEFRRAYLGDRSKLISLLDKVMLKRYAARPPPPCSRDMEC